MLDLRYDFRRQRVDIHLQAKRQRVAGRKSRSRSTELRSLDGLMQPQRVSPKGLIAVSIETKNLPALLDHRHGIRNHRVAADYWPATFMGIRFYPVRVVVVGVLREA